MDHQLEPVNDWFTAGASIPLWDHDAFPLVSDFPLYFRKMFRLYRKLSQFYLFPEKCLDFYPPKFLMTFFSHRPQISNFPPIFPLSVHFPPLFPKNYYFPLLFKISPYFPLIHLLFTCFLCISFPPYFDHDASPNTRTGRLWFTVIIVL